MRQSKQAQLLGRLVGIHPDKPWPRPASSTRQPAAVHVDPGRVTRELETLFRGGPQFVGMTDDCRNPGDFLTRRLGGVPVVVLCSKGGDLRAMVNACRHRGALVVKDLWPGDAYPGGIGINVLTSAEPRWPNGGAVFHDTAVWLRKSAR
jgi:hypothetical protein